MCFEVCNDVGGCQNYGPFLGTLNNRCRTILRTQKGTIILTTTHVRLIREKVCGPLQTEIRNQDSRARFTLSQLGHSQARARFRAMCLVEGFKIRMHGVSMILGAHGH